RPNLCADDPLSPCAPLLDSLAASAHARDEHRAAGERLDLCGRRGCPACDPARCAPCSGIAVAAPAGRALLRAHHGVTGGWPVELVAAWHARGLGAGGGHTVTDQL